MSGRGVGVRTERDVLCSDGYRWGWCQGRKGFFRVFQGVFRIGDRVLGTRGMFSFSTGMSELMRIFFM